MGVAATLPQLSEWTLLNRIIVQVQNPGTVFSYLASSH